MSSPFLLMKYLLLFNLIILESYVNRYIETFVKIFVETGIIVESCMNLVRIFYES